MSHRATSFSFSNRRAPSRVAVSRAHKIVAPKSILPRLWTPAQATRSLREAAQASLILSHRKINRM
jgi:hypothetical protein